MLFTKILEEAVGAAHEEHRRSTVKGFPWRARVSPVVVEMHRQYSDIFSLYRDHFQTVSSQEVEHANLSIRAAGQHAKEDQSQRLNLPVRKPAAGLETWSVLEKTPQGAHLENA